MMAWVVVIAAAGWIPGVLLSGHALAGCLGASRVIDRWVLSSAAGLMLWTIPMLLAGGLGVFLPWAFGLAGWLAAVVLALRLRWQDEWEGLEVTPSGLLVAVLAILAGVLSLIYTGESFLGGRDQGGYANHALHIAHTGSVWIPFPFESFGEARFGPLHFLQNLSNLNFMSDGMEAQFPPIYTIWMAQTAAVFGRVGVLGFNPILAALTVPLVYRLGRLFLDRPAAFVVLTVFLLNPAQLWMPRITLSEISAQHFMLAAMFCLAGGWLVRKGVLVGMGALFLGFVFWIRIDGLVVAPALVVALAAVLLQRERTAESGPTDRQLFLQIGWIVALVFLGGAVCDAVFTEQYFYSIGPLLLRIAGLTVVLLPVALVLLIPTVRDRLRGILGLRWVALSLCGALVALLIWTYWVRPQMEPFTMIAGDTERGRTFRENSLVNLVAYLSEPGALLTLVGLVAAVWAFLHGRLATAWILPLTAWSGFTALYLYDPSISPDHIWAVRRFVPVVIPGCALLAGFGSAVLTRRVHSPNARNGVAAGVCLLLVLVMLPRSSVFLLFKENKGSEAFLAELETKIPEGSLVFADTGTLFFDPLYPGLGRRVVRVNLSDPRMSEMLATVIRENVGPGESVFYLTQKRLDPFIESEEIIPLGFGYDFIAPTTAPPPTEIGHHAYQLFLYRSKSAPHDPSLGFGAITAGNLPIAGVIESGFHGSEMNGFAPFRWTDGHARLEIPLRDGYRPRSLRVDIRGMPPGGGEVVITSNGDEIFREVYATPPGTFEIDLPDGFDAPVLRLEIRSGTFIPAELPDGGNDQRVLGVCIYGVTLSSQPASKGRFELVPAASSGVIEGGFHGTEVNENGAFRWTDGSAWAEIPLPLGYVVRRIDLSILDLPPDGADVDLLLNGQSVFKESYTIPPGEISIAIENFLPAQEGETLRLDLESNTFHPSDQAGNTDDRILGLRVHEWVVTDRAQDAPSP